VKVNRDKTENSQAFLTVELEPAEVEESMTAAYRRLVKKMNIPGFRKGKTPRAVLERYIGREGILEEALNQLVPESCAQAIKEQEIEPIAQPKIEVTQTDPVTFTAVVPLAPTVELGDYHSIRMEPEKVEVTEDQINAVMEEVRHQQATWEPVERPAELKDLTVLDIASSIDGTPFINRQGVQYQLLPNSSAPAPGFAEQVVGMSKAEEKRFNIPFPSDYPRQELAGKEASFTVKMVEIKQEILPELNDELARQVSPDFDTLEALRKQIENNIRLGAERKSREDFEQHLLDAVVEQAKVEFPPIMVDVEIERLMSEQMNRIQMSKKGLEAYLKSINKTEEQLKDELRPHASRRIANSLVLGRIYQEEEIEVSESDINNEIENIIKDAQPEKHEEMRKILDNKGAKDSIRQALMTKKTIEKLTEIATGSGEAQSTVKEAEND